MTGAEVTKGASGGSAGSRRSTSGAATADIGTLSKIALQETFAEISASARKTSAASSSALKRLVQGAERRLGIEVSVEDPALRDLFGHLLQVETILCQLRAHGEALANGAGALAEGSEIIGGGSISQNLPNGTDLPKSLGESLLLFSNACSKGAGDTNVDDKPTIRSALAEVPNAVTAAIWQSISESPNANGCRGSSRYRMERRLNEEVYQVVDNQLAKHELLRDQVREREEWRQTLNQCQWEVVECRKQSRQPSATQASGLQPLSNSTTGDADERMQAAQAKVASIDADMLGQLMDIKRDARKIVSVPWISFAKIRAEFFASLAADWAPIATTLAKGLDTKSRRSGPMCSTSGISHTAPVEVVADPATSHPSAPTPCAAALESDTDAGVGVSTAASLLKDLPIKETEPSLAKLQKYEVLASKLSEPIEVQEQQRAPAATASTEGAMATPFPGRTINGETTAFDAPGDTQVDAVEVFESFEFEGNAAVAAPAENQSRVTAQTPELEGAAPTPSLRKVVSSEPAHVQAIDGERVMHTGSDHVFGEEVQAHEGATPDAFAGIADRADEPVAETAPVYAMNGETAHSASVAPAPAEETLVASRHVHTPSAEASSPQPADEPAEEAAPVHSTRAETVHSEPTVSTLEVDIEVESTHVRAPSANSTVAESREEPAPEAAPVHSANEDIVHSAFAERTEAPSEFALQHEGVGHVGGTTCGEDSLIEASQESRRADERFANSSDGYLGEAVDAQHIDYRKADPDRVRQIVTMIQHPKASALRALPIDKAKAYFLAKGVPEASVSEAFVQAGMVPANQASEEVIAEQIISTERAPAEGTPVSAAAEDDQEEF